MRRGEFCFWAIPDSISSEEAHRELKKALAFFGDYITGHNIKVVKSTGWYMPDGPFSPGWMIEKWRQLYTDIKKKGFAGLRIIGDASWVTDDDWERAVEYEKMVDEGIKDITDINALCLFNIFDIKSVVRISQVVNTHEDCFACK